MEDQWLTIDDVRGICPNCAEKMAKQGITRVKASAFANRARSSLLRWIQDLEKFIERQAWLGTEEPKAQLRMLVESGLEGQDVRVDEEFWGFACVNGWRQTAGILSREAQKLVSALRQATDGEKRAIVRKSLTRR